MSAVWLLPLSLSALSAGAVAVAARRVRAEAGAVVRATTVMRDGRGRPIQP
jgi:hypothetical protein